LGHPRNHQEEPVCRYSYGLKLSDCTKTESDPSGGWGTMSESGHSRHCRHPALPIPPKSGHSRALELVKTPELGAAISWAPSGEIGCLAEPGPASKHKWETAPGAAAEHDPYPPLDRTPANLSCCNGEMAGGWGQGSRLRSGARNLGR
jgi:hypothetical protein